MENENDLQSGKKYIRSFGNSPLEVEKSERECVKRIQEVKKNIEEACKNANREKTPMLLAATKTVSAEVINYVHRNAGINDIGENRVQELLAKYNELDSEIKVHFIGRLQKNKVKYLIGKVGMIHSVDSFELANEIAKRSLQKGVVTDVLIEVNSGKEENKGGVFIEEIDRLADRINALSGVRLCGLMVVAPKESENKDYYKYFEESYQFFIDFSRKKLHNIDNAVLSMGMSESYVAAVECGSTLVRVGSALFGQRPSMLEPSEK